MSVVVGYVPDASGLLAVRQGAQQAAWRNTDVIVVNVVGAVGHVAPTAADEQNLDAVAAELAAGGVAHSVRHVDAAPGTRPAEAILSVADEVGAELIVIGSKRTSAVAKAILGSTAQRVLLGASCPVLSVRADD